MKLSVGCGTNLICPDKSRFDLESAKKEVAHWMRTGFFSHRSRFVGKPHKERILCERYLETADGSSLRDYKFYCFHGQPKAILVIGDRFSEHKSAVFMSPDWVLITDMGEKQPHKYRPLQSLPGRPQSLTKMLEVAQALSAPFPFMRIDLYEIDGKVYFGEFTMCPHGCIGVAETEVNGKTMGELLDLSPLLRERCMQ